MSTCYSHCCCRGLNENAIQTIAAHHLAPLAISGSIQHLWVDGTCYIWKQCLLHLFTVPATIVDTVFLVQLQYFHQTHCLLCITGAILIVHVSALLHVHTCPCTCTYYYMFKVCLVHVFITIYRWQCYCCLQKPESQRAVVNWARSAGVFDVTACHVSARWSLITRQCSFVDKSGCARICT